MIPDMVFLVKIYFLKKKFFLKKYYFSKIYLFLVSEFFVQQIVWFDVTKLFTAAIYECSIS
jgi:hypothetical protein